MADDLAVAAVHNLHRHYIQHNRFSGLRLKTCSFPLKKCNHDHAVAIVRVATAQVAVRRLGVLVAASFLSVAPGRRWRRRHFLCERAMN
jgi:hypothetical protein